ncbi:MAG: hypothetical protein EAZ85_04325 [Bacteroidetes bacterium]|nr:MAG: hypothetical protein EAZ85_04325 [Bacteroidota bacterium]TAG88388.1 MAG: hypothetical protein EAZ20_08675 [Bacteroidota bacterium]
MKKLLLISILFLFSLGITLAQKHQQLKKIDVTYENCTVYTGKTDYFFKRIDNKEEIMVTVTAAPFVDKGQKVPDVPKGLVDDSKDLEGLPGAHPKMIGKPFVIFYDKNGEVVKVVKKTANKKK